jgi:hypothetical protein
MLLARPIETIRLNNYVGRCGVLRCWPEHGGLSRTRAADKYALLPSRNLFQHPALLVQGVSVARGGKTALLEKPHTQRRRTWNKQVLGI